VNIGIIGAGNVGGTLGLRWARAGHRVIFGSRDPQASAIKQLVANAGPTARAGSLAEAVRGGDMLLLATPWPATQSTVESLGPLNGKIVIDATNPLLPDLSGLEVGTNTSAGELVATWAAGAKVVKAFNTVGFNIMDQPSFGADRPVMFYCGDDGAAKQAVKQLALELGFDAVDAGPLTQARLLEPFALLWISLALVHGQGRDMAFKLLRR
jgi:predicted dinucleotide-binding enzyme